MNWKKHNITCVGTNLYFGNAQFDKSSKKIKKIISLIMPVSQSEKIIY